MDFARRQAYFGLFDGYHCYGPIENHLPHATCHGHDDEVIRNFFQVQRLSRDQSTK